MKNFAARPQKKKSATALFLLAFWLFGNAAQIFAHGGEDHGDQKLKATTSEKGTVTRTARLGEYELTLKHQLLEPDAAVAAKLFVTKFKTNEAAENAAAKIEIESAADGSVTEATIEKTDTAGSYSVKIPALPQGVYTVRTRLTYGGETDTATFSGVEVKTPPAVSSEGAMSRMRAWLIGLVFALVLALFGGLIYFVWHYADENSGGSVIRKETVSI